MRHGETEENKKSIIQGQRDTHLNNEGREQARLVAFALQEVAFDVAYTSDLIRASAVCGHERHETTNIDELDRPQRRSSRTILVSGSRDR